MLLPWFGDFTLKNKHKYVNPETATDGNPFMMKMGEGWEFCLFHKYLYEGVNTPVKFIISIIFLSTNFFVAVPCFVTVVVVMERGPSSVPSVARRPASTQDPPPPWPGGAAPTLLVPGEGPQRCVERK